MERISQGERILAVAGIVLFTSSFVNLWANIEVPRGPVEGFKGFKLLVGSDRLGRGDAWDQYGVPVQLGLIAALIAVVLVVAKAAGLEWRLPLNLGKLYTSLSGFATIMLLVGVLTGPSVPFEFFDADRGVLLFVGLFLAAAMTYGGYLHMIGAGILRQTPPEHPPQEQGPRPQYREPD